ncbi:fatty acid desaturase [Streptomyces sp. IBSNAI002]|uniref:fatty acid desaturase n=1 Tax=Streptomyces sp. IBSNAI002 TaxID=3457500 RepID=UPI003FD50474
MFLALALITGGVLLRQPDRLRFRRGRPHTAPAARLIVLQRARATNVTPVLLLVGQWVQITGYWLLAAHGPLAATTAALGVAVQFRHLQEISHHAVHGVLARTLIANRRLAEIGAHLPLVFGPVAVRRRRHVRDHHPSATLAADPNLVDLAAAGLHPGTVLDRRGLAQAVLHPLTPRGVRGTLTSLLDNLRTHHGYNRAAPAVGAVLAVLGTAYTVGGWPALVAGVLAPRLLLYPLLAWWSLLAEHTWFDPDHRTGTPAHVEAGRCLRLYPHNRILAATAAATWLPYGDLHHYAHSAHPGLRWNYLPALEGHLPRPHFTPDALLFGPRSVTRRHRAALARPAARAAAGSRSS